MARAILKTRGTTPENSEELIRAVREGMREWRHSMRRAVGIGSSWQDLGADFNINSLTTDSGTGCNVHRRIPLNGFVSARELGHAG